jgi:hypothetical protein
MKRFWWITGSPWAFERKLKASRCGKLNDNHDQQFGNLKVTGTEVLNGLKLSEGFSRKLYIESTQILMTFPLVEDSMTRKKFNLILAILSLIFKAHEELFHSGVFSSKLLLEASNGRWGWQIFSEKTFAREFSSLIPSGLDPKQILSLQIKLGLRTN